IEVIAPKVGGVRAGDGSPVAADQKLDGAPSVLYDAVVVLASPEGAVSLADMPAARDFVADAYAHSKFIAHTPGASHLLAASGLGNLVDDGFKPLGDGSTPADFLVGCRQLRFWPRRT